MNNKGQVFFYTFMLGITIIVLTIALAPAVKSIVDEKMNELTCTAPDSDWTQALCWILDLNKPLLIGGLLFVGIAVLLAKGIIKL